MHRVAFLTMDRLDGYVSDDDLLDAPMSALGWEVHPISWRSRGVNWDGYRAVIIRTTWDYQKDQAGFLRVLEEIAASTARLENSVDLVRWNIRKTYLLDLERRGIEIVPTRFVRGFDPARLDEFGDSFGTNHLVVKPVVSASAEDTFRLNPDPGRDLLEEVSGTLKGREIMIQPFMDGIVEEGEFSVFYFGGEYSHCILKTPRQNDFRVQEEHGGLITAVPPPAGLLAAADRVQGGIEPLPLYSRIDLVRTAAGRFAVMEVELIEPALYFRMDPASPGRFARVFDRWMNQKKKWR